MVSYYNRFIDRLIDMENDQELNTDPELNPGQVSVITDTVHPGDRLFSSKILIQSKKSSSTLQSPILESDLHPRDRVISYGFAFQYEMTATREGVDVRPFAQKYNGLVNEIRKYLVVAAEQILSVAYKYCFDEKLSGSEPKGFAAKNIILNVRKIYYTIVKAIREQMQREINPIGAQNQPNQINENDHDLEGAIIEQRMNQLKAKRKLIIFQAKLMQQVESILKKVLEKLAEHYPQAPPTGGTPRMRQNIIKIDRTRNRELDFLYTQRDKLKLNENQYNTREFILKTLNQLIKINDKIDEESEDQKTLFERFTQFNQNLFWLASKKQLNQIIKNITADINQPENRETSQIDLNELQSIIQNLKKQQNNCYIPYLKQSFQKSIEDLQEKHKILNQLFYKWQQTLIIKKIAKFQNSNQTDLSAKIDQEEKRIKNKTSKFLDLSISDIKAQQFTAAKLKQRIKISKVKYGCRQCVFRFLSSPDADFERFVVIISEYMKGSSENDDHLELKKRNQQIEEMKNQKKFQIGRKIPTHVQPFSDQQVTQASFKSFDSSLLRILTKWIKSIEEIFKYPAKYTRLAHDTLHNLENNRIYLSDIFMQEIQQVLYKTQPSLNEKLKQLKQNLVQDNSAMMSETLEAGPLTLEKHTESRIISLNNFIRLTHISFSYLQHLIKIILLRTKYRYNESINNSKSYKQLNILRLDVNDILRSRICCDEATFIKIFQIISFLDAYEIKEGEKPLLKIVEVKDKLNEPNNSVSVIYLFKGEIQCELQMSIKKKGKKQELAYQFSHMIYELTRGKFGVISQLSNLVVQNDDIMKTSKLKYSLPIFDEQSANYLDEKINKGSASICCIQCLKIKQQQQQEQNYPKCNICLLKQIFKQLLKGKRQNRQILDQLLDQDPFLNYFDGDNPPLDSIKLISSMDKCNNSQYYQIYVYDSKKKRFVKKQAYCEIYLHKWVLCEEENNYKIVTSEKWDLAFYKVIKQFTPLMYRIDKMVEQQNVLRVIRTKNESIYISGRSNITISEEFKQRYQRQIKKIRSIQINGGEIQAIPEWIQIFSNLMHLKLRSMNLQSINQGLISRFTCLKQLNLSHNNIKHFSIKDISSLQSLDLSLNPLVSVKIQNMKNLNHLILMTFQCVLSDSFHLANLPSLKKLEMHNQWLQELNLQNVIISEEPIGRVNIQNYFQKDSQVHIPISRWNIQHNNPQRIGGIPKQVSKSKFSAQQMIIAESNVEELTIQDGKYLKQLYIVNNVHLKKLKLQKLPSLLNLSILGNHQLLQMRIIECNFGELEISNKQYLKQLYIVNNVHLKKLKLQKLPSLLNLSILGNHNLLKEGFTFSQCRFPDDLNQCQENMREELQKNRRMNQVQEQ